MGDVRVPFHGATAGEAELTWGQRVSWRSMQRPSASDQVGGTVRLDEGVTLEAVAWVLGRMVSRHESLRTRLRIDAAGRPRQVVAATGDVVLRVVDAGDDEEPAEVAARIRRGFETTRFDLTTELPVRWAVIRHRGRPAYLVSVYPHIFVDGHAFDALRADLANLDPDTRRELAPPAGLQPLELAREQCGPVGQRRSAVALRHWEQQLRAIPANPFARPSPEGAGPAWLSRRSSPAAHLALRVIAARTGVHTGAVLLAAHGLALGRLTGVHPTVVRIQVSNRFRRGLELAVMSLVQYALCVIDARDRPFDDVVGQAWRSMVEAGKYAYCDAWALWELVDRIGAERGEAISLGSFFNDRRRAPDRPESAVPTAREIEDARSVSRVSGETREHLAGAGCVLRTDPADGSLDYECEVDQRCITPDEADALLLDIESILVAAAVAPAGAVV